MSPLVTEESKTGTNCIGDQISATFHRFYVHCQMHYGMDSSVYK